jgi:hypothetical protein
MPVNFTESAPPKKAATAKRSTPAPRQPNPDNIRKEREDALNGLFQVGGVIAMAFGKWADAGAINTHGPNITTETVKLADKYESVGKSIDALAQVSPFAGLVAAITPLVIQLAVNHKMISPTQASGLGATDPQVLAQQMQIEVNRQAIQIQLRMAEEKRLMDAELAELQREMEAAKERETVTA